MTQLDDSTSVRVAIEVTVPPARAFEVFAQIDTWWNRAHHLLPGELKQVVIEPMVGGRVWEENDGGETCEWGEVLVWEPGRRFAFSWRIGPDWNIPAADAPASRVTVTFSPTAAGTQVEVVHSEIDRHGEGWQDIRDSVAGDRGWPSLLQSFAASAG